MKLRTAICAALFLVAQARGATLRLEIRPTVSGEPLQPASFRYRTSAGEVFSITRLSYLLSGFALQREGGSWLELSNTVAWLDFAQNRDSVRLDDVPAGQYRSIRFSVGLKTNWNHANSGQFPPGHPLNPNVNGLYWGWQGGYIFMALEGLWRNARGEMDGWAYHLARDGNDVPVVLPAALDLTGATKVEIGFDLAALLNAPQPLSFARDGSSTHSRPGDTVAVALIKNMPGAFHVQSIRAWSETEIARAEVRALYLPKKFTPFPFQMSATFPQPALPHDNPLIEERVSLGRALFFDKQLSVNGRQSCADCHSPSAGFVDHQPLAVGAEGEIGKRRVMPLFNLAWKSSYFWDGRAVTLRQQVLQPIQNPHEMHESLSNVVDRLARPQSPYSALFQSAFGTREITAAKLALALENYLLTLTSFDSKFDRVLRGEEKFTPEERRGLELFSTEYDPRRGQFGADCFHCHGGPLFQSQGFANNGLDAVFSDIGRAAVTGKDSDVGKFAVPSLRNVALRAPYMHDGRFQTLEQVVEHYSTGVKRSPTLDPNIAKHPDGGLPLSATDKKALVAFLRTLTDPRFIPAQEMAHQ